jgi:hypothetical protein
MIPRLRFRFVGAIGTAVSSGRPEQSVFARRNRVRYSLLAASAGAYPGMAG